MPLSASRNRYSRCAMIDQIDLGTRQFAICRHQVEAELRSRRHALSAIVERPIRI
jgi:hypothetical protein